MNNFLLHNEAKSKLRTGEPRMYLDLLKGKFAIGNIIRIDCQDDKNTISNKWADYSFKTINQLIGDGYKQATKQLEN